MSKDFNAERNFNAFFYKEVDVEDVLAQAVCLFASFSNNRLSKYIIN